MSEVHVETMPPPTDEDDDEPTPLLSVRVSISELDERWHSADTMLQAAMATPDEIADALIRCSEAVAQARGEGTLLALQQRLIEWGNHS